MKLSGILVFVTGLDVEIPLAADEGLLPFLVGLMFLLGLMMMAGLLLGLLSKGMFGGRLLFNIPLAIVGSIAGGVVTVDYGSIFTMGYSMNTEMLLVFMGALAGAGIALITKRVLLGPGIDT